MHPSRSQPLPRSILLLVIIASVFSTLLTPSPTARADGWDDLPITDQHRRVWVPIVRTEPFQMGAVEAFLAPERAREAGVRWSRVVFDWSAIQRHGPQDWTIGWLDEEMMRREKAEGRPVVGVLMSTPSWASGTSDPRSPPRGMDLPLDDPRNVWATWVRTIVGRYAGLVDTWVMWNEPDIWHDGNDARQWAGTVEEYYQLLKTGYLAAKQANPQAKVLMAGMTYWWDKRYGREQYFSRVLDVAARDESAPAHNWYFDGAVLQLYNDPRNLFDAAQQYHVIMRRYGISNPVWINETNAIPWDDPVAPLTRDHFRMSMEEQASYLVQAVAYALAGGVDRLAVYKMRDDGPLRPGVDQPFGMVRDDAPHNTPRPIYETFRMLQRELEATTRVQLVDAGDVNRVYLEQPSLGRRLTVFWTTNPGGREIVEPALGDSAEVMDKFGRAQPLEVHEGRVFRLALAPATVNTMPGYPQAYFVGGDPLVVIEPLPIGYQPFAPSIANLPPAVRPTSAGDSDADSAETVPGEPLDSAPIAGAGQ